jgi:hypothetical protein
MPSLLDCSLGTTYGFTAAVLIENELTGMCAVVKSITGPPSTWRIGGVPLLAML